MKKSSNSGRPLAVKLKTSRGRTVSSQNWLRRQLNDPFVAQAKTAGYRSRAAFKLLGIDEKYKILKPGLTVVDLGAAPGGWTQVAIDKVGKSGCVVGIDLTPIDPIPGAHLICGDFLDPEVVSQLKASLSGPIQIVLSDMAAPSTGHPQTDHIRIMTLAEEAFCFAKEVLDKNGVFVAKVLRGGTEKELLTQLKKHFEKVSHFKPPASRADSAEIFVVAIGFRP